MYNELIKSGCMLMLLGMGTVFFFLTIMIFCMQISSKVLAIINKYFPEEIIDNKTVKNKTSKINEEIAVAIAIAKRGGI